MGGQFRPAKHSPHSIAWIERRVPATFFFPLEGKKNLMKKKGNVNKVGKTLKLGFKSQWGRNYNYFHKTLGKFLYAFNHIYGMAPRLPKGTKLHENMTVNRLTSHFRKTRQQIWTAGRIKLNDYNRTFTKIVASAMQLNEIHTDKHGLAYIGPIQSEGKMLHLYVPKSELRGKLGKVIQA